MMRCALFLLLAVFYLASPALAGPNQDHPAKAAWIADIGENASYEERAHFLEIYTGYSILGTVEMVRADVQKTAGLCADKNPSIREKMRARFKAWDAAIAPVLAEVRGHLDNMVLAQTYAEEESFRALFADIDAQRKATLAGVDKVYKTELSACAYLHDTMDSTQENMLALLRQSLISVPAAPMVLTEPPIKPEPSGEDKPSADASSRK